MDTSETTGTGERPLNAGAKTLLMIGVGATILSFYIFSALAVLCLLALLGIEFIIFLVLARFLAARIIAPTIGKHIGLLGLVGNSFRRRKGVAYQISLTRDDAPSLHRIVESLCQRLGLSFPQKTVLQMGDVAWVQLKGIRKGAGKVTLGVGYDLLAGLSVVEMEAVLAHEMTHAKLINRGYRNWLLAGQGRARTLAMALWADINNDRRAKKSSAVAHALFMPVDWLLRLATKLTAAYSRQDEFEADLGAAKLCGSAVMKSALSKLESLHQITSRLPWNERVAQLQHAKGYSQWLLAEIASGSTIPSRGATTALFDKYSTHPSIQDRLAALPPDDKPGTTDSPSGIQLLARPDSMAIRLVTELQRMLAEQEKKDSQVLEKFSRKTGRNANLRPWQSFGVLLVLCGFVSGLIGLGAKELAVVVEPISIAGIIIGIVAIRLGKYRDRMDLPVPAYAMLVAPVVEKPTKEQIQARQNAIETELTNRFAAERKSQKALLLAKEAYSALKTCEYLKAHVAARQCLKFDNKSVEAALALAIACASFGQIPDTARLLAFVQKSTGFQTFSTTLGAAWAALLAGDWIRAEAMLEKALKSHPDQNTLVSLLAIAQARRGKLQSSIVNARRSCEADPTSRDKIKFLIGRLLDGGYTQEVQNWIQRVKSDPENDVELMVFQTHLALLERNFEKAEQWTFRVKEAGATAQKSIQLGKLYETARFKEQSAKLYQEALALDHYPEAHLGLGRLETELDNKEKARKHILDALNVDRTVGKEGCTTWQILHPILNQMLWLHDPIPNCQAWVAAVPSNVQPAALAGQNFMVYAADLPQAQVYFQTMLDAFQPGKPPLILPQSCWKSAPKPLQPNGPVRPGVQGIWN